MSVGAQNLMLIALIILISVLLLAFPVSADSNDITFPILTTESTILASGRYSTDFSWSANVVESDAPVYLFFRDGPYNSSSSQIAFGPGFISTYPAKVTITRQGTTRTVTLELDETTGLYFGVPLSWIISSTSSYSYETHLPVFSDWRSALDYFSGNVVSPSFATLRYTLPPGNALYVQVSSGSEYSLNVRMPESVLGSNHYPGNNQVATLVSSLPSGGSAPSAPLVPWVQSGALSALGLSRNATYSGTTASSGYLCIVNPLYYSGTANGPYEFMANGSIEITVDTQSVFYVYPLDSQLRFTSGLGIGVDTTIIDTPYDGQFDPDTGYIIWTDPEGGNQSPDFGGGNLEPVSETIFDWLRNISQQFADFLKGPVNAVQVVVNAIRDFMGSFVQLYSWLPTPVYQLITSALMIALTIGVIKIFV